jgi:hypothetical protein
LSSPHQTQQQQQQQQRSPENITSQADVLTTPPTQSSYLNTYPNHHSSSSGASANSTEHQQQQQQQRSQSASRGLLDQQHQQQQQRTLIGHAPLSATTPNAYRLTSPPHGSLGGYAAATQQHLLPQQHSHHQQQQQQGFGSPFFPPLYPGSTGTSSGYGQQQSAYGGGDLFDSFLLRGSSAPQNNLGGLNLDLDLARKAAGGGNCGDASSFARLSSLTSLTQGSRSSILQQQQQGHGLFASDISKLRDVSDHASALLQSLQPARYGQEVVDGSGVWRPY